MWNHRSGNINLEELIESIKNFKRLKSWDPNIGIPLMRFIYWFVPSKTIDEIRTDLYEWIFNGLH